MAMIDHANLPKNPADMVLGQVGGKVKVGIVARKQMDDLQRAWSVPDTHWYVTRSISLIMEGNGLFRWREVEVQLWGTGKCFPQRANLADLPYRLRIMYISGS